MQTITKRVGVIVLLTRDNGVVDEGSVVTAVERHAAVHHHGKELELMLDVHAGAASQ